MRVIIFQGKSQYDVMRRFSYRYVKALNELGIETILYDMVNVEDTNEYLELVSRFKPNFTMGFNPVAIYFDKGIWHNEKTSIPHFVFLLDHPYYHLDRILSKPNHPLVHTIYLEKNYEEAIKHLNIKNITRKINLSSEQVLYNSFNSKIYDMVFFGTLQAPETTLIEIDKQVSNPFLKKLIIEFLVDITKVVCEDKVFLEQDIEFYFKSYMKNYYSGSDEHMDNLVRNAYPWIDTYYRNLTREEVIKGFAREGIKISVFGNARFKEILSDYSQIKVFAPVSYHDCMNIVAQSKITLNISPMFQSYHDRIPLAYMNRSILCTNVMEDLINILPESLNNTLYYNMHNISDVANIIKGVISNKEEFEMITENAFQMASQHFSPEKDVKELLEIYHNAFK